MEMSGLFLAATRDSRQWPSYAPGFLNIQLECGEVVAVCVCLSSMSVYVHLTERERETIGALPTQAS